MLRFLPYIGPARQGAFFQFGLWAARATYAPFLGVFYARRGLTGGEIGLLAAVGLLIALLLTPTLMAFADRNNWRVRMLSICLIGCAVAVLIIPLTDSFLTLLLVIALLTMVSSPIAPLSDSLLTRMGARHGLSYGKMRLWGSIAWALVAAAGGALWQEVGFVYMFVAGAILFALPLIITQLLHEERVEHAQSKGNWRVVIADKRLRALLISAFAFGLGLGLNGTYAGINIDKLGGGQFLVGIFAGVSAISEVPSMNWSETILRRLGGPKTLLICYALLGIAFFGVAMIRQPELLLAMGLFQGLGFGLFTTTAVRLVSLWSPPQWASTSQGLFSSTAWGLAPLLAAPLGGFIYDWAGTQAVFATAAFAVVVGAFVVVVAMVLGVFRTKDANA